MRTILFAAALVLPTAPAGAQAPPPRLHWQRDWKIACEIAASERKLLLVCVMKDSEPACVEMIEKVYADAAVARKLANFVLVPCSVSTHDLTEIEVDGQPVATCPRFPGVLCSQHQALERELRDRFLDPVTKEVTVPHHAVLAADGTPIVERPYAMRREGFLEFLGGALSQGADPSAAAAPIRSPAIQKVVDAIVKARDDGEREEAARELFADVSPEREQAFVEVMARLRREEDQAVVIRAAGRAQHRAWAPSIASQLESKRPWIRNCAVVTLEEEGNPAVLDALLALWEREKDAETRKDIVRALGPCGAKQNKPRELLLGELASPRAGHRAAAALSLGHFLAGDPEVGAALEARWQKERDEKVKLAILWGIGQSDDAAQVELVDRLVKDERNANVADLAENVRQRLRGGGGPPGAGGGGDRGGWGGAWRVLRLLAPVYADDKVQRNAARDFGRGGGR